MDPTSGRVTNNRVLDFDGGQETVEFSVLAAAPGLDPTDPERTPRVSEARVTIKLQDVNDNEPVFEKEVRMMGEHYSPSPSYAKVVNPCEISFQSYSVSVREDSLPLTELLTLSATDADSGPNGRLRYSLEGAEGAGAFEVGI